MSKSPLRAAFDEMQSANTEAVARKAMLKALRLYLPEDKASATMQAMRTLVPVALNRLGLPIGVLKMATRYRMILTAKPAKGGRSAGARMMAAQGRLERIREKRGAR